MAEGKLRSRCSAWNEESVENGNEEESLKAGTTLPLRPEDLRSRLNSTSIESAASDSCNQFCNEFASSSSALNIPMQVVFAHRASEGLTRGDGSCDSCFQNDRPVFGKIQLVFFIYILIDGGV